MPTGEQIRAARALLNWSAADLAAEVGIRRESILFIESEEKRPKESTTLKIMRVFDKQGIEFIDQTGVKRRNDTLRLLDVNDPYIQVLDDALHTIGSGSLLYFMFADNRVSSERTIDMQLRLRARGIRFRYLIEENPTPYCLYPLEEYRCLPSRYYRDNVQFIYGDKVATIMKSNKFGFLIHNADYAETQRGLFAALWDVYPVPTHSGAPKIYA